MYLQALVSLQAMYTRMADQGKPAPNEAEFRAYQLMLSMGTHGKYFYSAASFFASLKVSGYSLWVYVMACRAAALEQKQLS